jgi:hypothetical protein
VTAERAPETRTVTVERARYPRGYWGALVGCELRMPAVVVEGRVLAGFLVAAEESDEAVTLTFSDIGPED